MLFFSQYRYQMLKSMRYNSTIMMATSIRRSVPKPVTRRRLSTSRERSLPYSNQPSYKNLALQLITRYNCLVSVIVKVPAPVENYVNVTHYSLCS